MAVNGFRDLRVWQLGMDLTAQVYQVTRTFPKHELYGLASQMQRAAVAVPSNIAEGHTRAHLREYLQHIAIAQGSLAELQTQLEIATHLDYLSPAQLAPLVNQATTLAKQLYSLRNALMRGNGGASPTPNTQHPPPVLE
ncbi:MAG: four helix bundle protein [Solimonas sp.]